MALSRMLRISELCHNKTVLLQKPNQTRFSRSFRKNRHEEDAFNTKSIENPLKFPKANAQNLTASRLWKPFFFTVGFTTVSFGGAAIWEYERMRAHALKMIKKPIKFFRKKADADYQKPHPFFKPLRTWWNSLSAGEKVFVPICALNLLVFAAWRVPKWQPFMLKYFSSNPANKAICLPMILSTFSHYSGFHLFANMYVLHSFSTGAVHSLGQEQFLALYLSSGVLASFTSCIYKVITKQPGLSLGASGSIMAILGYVCTQYPDTKLGIILLPIFEFSAGSAIKFIVGLDTMGVILGWKFFDHAAHLGGAMFGILWAWWGNQYIWQKREPLLRYWHDFRGSIK